MKSTNRVTAAYFVDIIGTLRNENKQLKEALKIANKSIYVNTHATIVRYEAQWVQHRKNSVYCTNCGYVVKEIDKSNYCPDYGAVMNR